MDDSTTDALAAAVAAAAMFDAAGSADLDTEEVLAWSAFTSWCDNDGSEPMPADPDAVHRWLTSLEPGSSRDIAGNAVAAMHLRSGHDDPVGAL